MEQHDMQHTRTQMEWMDKTLPLEWSAEITLPDYRSEVSRLLWVRPVFSVPARFIGNGKVDFSGTVCYHVLYAGPDGQLYSTAEEVPYEFSLPLEGGNDMIGAAELWAELQPDTVVSRVAAPRRLSLRCRLHAQVHGHAVRELAPRLVGEGEGELLRLCEPASAAVVATGTSDVIAISDEILPEMGEELRVVSVTGEVFLPEVHATEGAVHCKGEIICGVLVTREAEGADGVPFVITRRVPFAEQVPVEGASPDCDALATGSVGAWRATVTDGRVELSAELVLEAEARREEHLCYTKDLFMPGMTTECHHRVEGLYHHCWCGNRNFSVSGELQPEELGIPAEAELLLTAAEAEVGSVEREGGRTALVGSVSCHLLYKYGREFQTAEAAFPFRVVLEEDYPEVECRVSVPICRATPARDRLRMDAELQLALRAFSREEVRVLAEAVFSPLPAMARASMEICYPQAEETLWEVAKRYGCSPEGLAAANGIQAEAPGSAASLAGVRYLIIP